MKASHDPRSPASDRRYYHTSVATSSDSRRKNGPEKLRKYFKNSISSQGFIVLFFSGAAPLLEAIIRRRSRQAIPTIRHRPTILNMLLPEQQPVPPPDEITSAKPASTRSSIPDSTCPDWLEQMN